MTEQTPGQKIANAIMRCFDAQNVRYGERDRAMSDAHHLLIEEIDAALADGKTTFTPISVIQNPAPNAAAPSVPTCTALAIGEKDPSR